MRRTKIVATLGPASDDRETIRRLIRAGMNVARLNFSHGSHEDHRRAFEAVRTEARALECNVAVMMDLQGPKIRTGALKNSKDVQIHRDAELIITTEQVEGDALRVSTSYRQLPYDVRPGNTILVAEGAIELRVEAVAGSEVRCTVVRGGALGEHKGINLPGVKVSAPSLTDKDDEDLAFGLRLGVDYVALSFVRSSQDIQELKRRIGALGMDTPVVAKIERPEAVENFDAILEETDAVMVARGDLGVEMSLFDVPQIQKEIIRKCNQRAVPVITATQMLESMMVHARPTRAEVTDVANAIYDGTDAVMLSGETAVGQHPVDAVLVMAGIAAKADAANAGRSYTNAPVGGVSIASDAIGRSVRYVCDAMEHIKQIVCFTQSGYTAARIARFRPTTPITAFTLREESRRRCALFWGVDAVETVEARSIEDMLEVVDRELLVRGLAGRGDVVVIVAGTPLAVGGRTNLLKIHVVNEG